MDYIGAVIPPTEAIEKAGNTIVFPDGRTIGAYDKLAIKYGYTAVDGESADRQHAEVAAILLHHKCDVNSTDARGRTALHWLCTLPSSTKGRKKGQMEFVKSDALKCGMLLLDPPTPSKEASKSSSALEEGVVCVSLGYADLAPRRSTHASLACCIA